MRVAISEYHTGGTGDDKNVSSMNYKLTDANGTPYEIAHHAFAELDNGHALGHLPMGAQVFLQVDGGGYATLTKVDEGIGGTGKDGLPRAIDLFGPTVQTLGLTRSDGLWTGTVTGPGVTGDTGGSAPPGVTPVSSSGGITDAITSGLGPFLGLIGGQSIQDKMSEFVIRAVEVVAGTTILSAGIVMFALQFTGVSLGKGIGVGVKAVGTDGLSLAGTSKDSFKKTPDGSKQGTSTKDVRDLQPGGMTKASDRVAAAAIPTEGAAFA